MRDASGKERKRDTGVIATADSDLTITASWNKKVKDEVMVKLVPGADDVVLPDGYELGDNSTCLFKAPFGQIFDNLGLDQASRSGYTLDGWYTSRGAKMTGERRLKDNVFDRENGEFATIEDADGFVYHIITLTARWSKHPMLTPKYTWADDRSTCTAERHCSQEGCTECAESETVNSTQEVVTAPSCKTKGQTIYTKEFGSVIIKLKPEYLETLALGKHTLTAQFNDASAGSFATFTVAQKDDSSGDAENDGCDIVSSPQVS